MVLGILDSLFPQAQRNVSQQNVNDNKQGLGNRASNILSAFTNPTPSQAAKLAMGFNSLTLDPDPQFTAAMQKRIDDGSAMERANQTAMYLEQMGQTDLANLVRSGGISGADALSYISSLAKAKGTTYGNTGLTDELLGVANTIGDDYRKSMQNFDLVKNSYDAVQLYYKDQSATSDYALAVAFAKMLDPISVVRQSEVDAVNRSADLLSAVIVDLKKTFDTKAGLPDSVRDEIMRLSHGLYQKRLEEAQVLESNTTERANALHPKLMDYVYFGRPVSEIDNNTKVSTDNNNNNNNNNNNEEPFVIDGLLTPDIINEVGLDGLSTLDYDMLDKTWDAINQAFIDVTAGKGTADQQAFIDSFGNQEQVFALINALTEALAQIEGDN